MTLNIYHAANIRIYEEVGLIKGMTNLQWNFGYNSAALAFAAFFSLGWLLPQPLHVTTGFFELIFAVYACHYLKNWRVHKTHMGDACCIAIWVYILVILVRSMSPATDFMAMLLALYGITAWIINCESKKNISEYAMLSVFMVYALTVKLSAGCMVLIAIYPFIMLIKQKKVKTILGYILMGIIVLMPYLIRNYYLSGWLIYPFAAIDIFNPDWKVPLSTLQRDSAFIKVYGRCVYDPEKVNMPIKEWVRIWWAGQRYYERLLIMSVFLSSVLIFIHELYRLIRGKIEWERTFMYLAIWASTLLWFIEAPFIRYGLAFLLSIPLLAAGICVDAHKCGFRRIALGITLLTIFLMYTPYVDNYFQDFGVFVKHELKSGYYLVQKDYDIVPTDSQQVGPFTFQFPSKGETNSYYAFPGVAYSDRLFEIEARGDTLRDGFRHK